MFCLGLAENVVETDLLQNMTLFRLDTESDYFYYLSADYQQTDDNGNMCVHMNPYIFTTLNSTYELFTSQLPYNISFEMKHTQEIPHNFTLKYQNGSDVDLNSNTWLTVDYSDVKKFNNNDMNVTIDTPPTITGSTYAAHFPFNFYVYTKDADYPVYEDKYINISIYNEPINSSPISDVVVT